MFFIVLLFYDFDTFFDYDFKVKITISQMQNCQVNDKFYFVTLKNVLIFYGTKILKTDKSVELF